MFTNREASSEPGRLMSMIKYKPEPISRIDKRFYISYRTRGRLGSVGVSNAAIISTAPRMYTYRSAQVGPRHALHPGASPRVVGLQRIGRPHARHLSDRSRRATTYVDRRFQKSWRFDFAGGFPADEIIRFVNHTVATVKQKCRLSYNI